jgi:hypothetical protein
MKLRQIQASSITPLWCLDYWNGPLSGICIYKDRPCYFTNKCNDFLLMEKDLEIYDIRQYILYYITEEEFKLEELCNHDWKEWVGTHADFNPDWTRKEGEVKSSETHDLFYTKWGKGSKLSQDRSLIYEEPGIPIGFFTLGNLRKGKKHFRKYQLFDKAYKKQENRKLPIYYCVA